LFRQFCLTVCFKMTLRLRRPKRARLPFRYSLIYIVSIFGGSFFHDLLYKYAFILIYSRICILFALLCTPGGLETASYIV